MSTTSDTKHWRLSTNDIRFWRQKLKNNLDVWWYEHWCYLKRIWRKITLCTKFKSSTKGNCLHSFLYKGKMYGLLKSLWTRDVLCVVQDSSNSMLTIGWVSLSRRWQVNNANSLFSRQQQPLQHRLAHIF